MIGIYSENSDDGIVTQLFGDKISSSRLIHAMEYTTMLYTYNGARFDLPFIKAKLNIDLTVYCRHEDLMYSCWKKNRYGGLKGVERQLGIERKLPDIDGWAAVQLWHKYKHYGDRESLEKLLKYNHDDILHLITLREMFHI